MDPTPTLPPSEADIRATAPNFAPLIVLLWNRLSRVARRAERLMARLADGRLAAGRLARPCSPARPRLEPLPTRHAWLIIAIPNEAACYGSRLQFLLDDPSTPALLAAAPTTLRLLRPLCRMLGLADPTPAAMRSPPREPPAARAQPSAKPPKPRTPHIPTPSDPWPRTSNPRTLWLVRPPPDRKFA